MNKCNKCGAKLVEVETLEDYRIYKCPHCDKEFFEEECIEC